MTRLGALVALLVLLAPALLGQSMAPEANPRSSTKIISSGPPRSSLILELRPENYRYVPGGTDVWHDSSGNGYNFTQGTAANKPAYRPQTNSVRFEGAKYLSGPELPLESAHSIVFKFSGDYAFDDRYVSMPAKINFVGAYSTFFFGHNSEGRRFYVKVASDSLLDWTNANSEAGWYWDSSISEQWGQVAFIATRYNEAETPKLSVFKWAGFTPVLTQVRYSMPAFTVLPHASDIVSTCQLGNNNINQHFDIAGIWVFNTALATATLFDAINW